jgi:hypothetical protein
VSQASTAELRGHGKLFRIFTEQFSECTDGARCRIQQGREQITGARDFLK